MSAMNLTEFLLAQIAEDRELALAAEDSPSSEWIYIDAGERNLAWEFDRERVLAECEAKRKIVEAYKLRREQGFEPGGEVVGYHATGLGIAVRNLAAVYADRPDFREEWRS